MRQQQRPTARWRLRLLSGAHLFAPAPVATPAPVPAQAALDPATMSEADFLAYTLAGLRTAPDAAIIKASAETLAAITNEEIGEDVSRHPFFY